MSKFISALDWSAIDRVFNQDSMRLADLALAASRDPSNFFVGRDFRGLSLQGIDIRGVNLSQADLRNCQVRKSVFDLSTNFSGAKFDLEDRKFFDSRPARTSELIAPHLPQLRRFARALSGSQSLGDSLVVDTLEAISAKPSLIEDRLVAKTDLYRILINSYLTKDFSTDASYNVIDSSDEIKTAFQLNLISPKARIALLLTALEGFENDEVALSLACSSEDARQFLDIANHEISNNLRTTVLIIEDEPFVAQDIHSLLEDLGHKVIEVATTHKQAVATAKKMRPGLILADIQLADGSSGLEAVGEILNDFEVAVIFVTAYPERFLTGAPPEPCFLLAKPFSTETLRAVISQVLFFDRKSHRRDIATSRNPDTDQKTPVQKKKRSSAP